VLQYLIGSLHGVVIHSQLQRERANGWEAFASAEYARSDLATNTVGDLPVDGYVASGVDLHGVLGYRYTVHPVNQEPSPVHETIDEAEPGPIFVDGADLVVDESGLQATCPDMGLLELGRERRFHLGPTDPKSPVFDEPLGPGREAPTKDTFVRDEGDRHVERPTGARIGKEPDAQRQITQGPFESLGSIEGPDDMLWLDPKLLGQRRARISSRHRTYLSANGSIELYFDPHPATAQACTSPVPTPPVISLALSSRLSTVRTTDWRIWRRG
jgi:hypothetical protein